MRIMMKGMHKVYLQEVITVSFVEEEKTLEDANRS